MFKYSFSKLRFIYIALLLALLLTNLVQADEQVKNSAKVEHFNPEFQTHWSDGNAELAAYKMTFSRYGEQRQGLAVSIFVTEDFSKLKRVKSDQPQLNPVDTFPVMKLNLMHDFPTGIYDYHLMTSSFVSLKPFNDRGPGHAMKVSFSGQEWCGHMYQQLLFDRNSIRNTLHSYFESEADRIDLLRYPAVGISEDTLFHWARNMAAPFLKAGESREIELLTSLQKSRLSHTGPAWKNARLIKGKDSKSLEVKAGTFEVVKHSVQVNKKDLWTFYVEKAFPHRIIKWEAVGLQKAELLGAKRLPYWKLNSEGYQSELKSLGVSPRAAETT